MDVASEAADIPKLRCAFRELIFVLIVAAILELLKNENWLKPVSGPAQLANYPMQWMNFQQCGLSCNLDKRLKRPLNNQFKRDPSLMGRLLT
jgi:hypothetical protein